MLIFFLSADATKAAPKGKTMHNGVAYDFVISIDVDEGQPARKLPYNMTEEPWRAAQDFINRENIPQVLRLLFF